MFRSRQNSTKVKNPDKKLYSFNDFQSNTQRIFAGKCDIKKLFANFQKLGSNYERVYFAYGMLRKYNFLPDVSLNSKCDETAEKQRLIGNQVFTIKKDFLEAMQIYNESIAHAQSKNVLALAYANRSAVFFQIALYKECLKDIQFAFDNDYPKNLHEKLKNRKEKAEIMILKSKSRIPEDYFSEIPRLSGPKNNYFQNASYKVEMKYSKKFGRHIIAKEDIEPGDIIAVEKPYTQILLHECRLTHCSHCLEIAYNLIPCLRCPFAMYCGQKCRQAAWNKYHQYECSILGTLRLMNASKFQLLALRVVLRARNEFSAILNNEMRPTKELPVYKAESYEEIHNLITNQNRRSTDDFFGRTLIAAVILHLLKSTSFFDCDLDVSDMKKCTANLLLQHLQTIPCNMHKIFEFCREPQNVCESAETGGAVYSFRSLLNHSCSPNVLGENYGASVVIRALESIPRGQQLFSCNGCHYVFASRAERRKYLREQYYFTCQCVACIHDWIIERDPPTAEFTPIFTKFTALSTGNRQIAVELIPELIGNIKRYELLPEMHSTVMDFKRFLQYCFSVLANKRTTFESV